MSAPEYLPGSREAIAQGCICSPTLNRHGQGTLHGEPRFYYHRKCPIHRADAEKRALEGGEVRAVRKARHEDAPTRH
jgi:hypothetical protein